eukprot:scaffold267829_cov71-Attheya_sp.AAC.1
MNAIAHSQVKDCLKQIGDMGFEIVLVELPALQEETQGENLREHIHNAWRCGHNEFIKLFAYTALDPNPNTCPADTYGSYYSISHTSMDGSASGQMKMEFFLDCLPCCNCYDGCIGNVFPVEC